MLGSPAPEPVALSVAPAARSRRITRWWAAAVCLSAFGPYIGGGRLEQAAVLGSVAWVLVTGWPRMLRARIPSPWPLILLAAIESVMLIGTVSRPPDPAFLGAQAASHGLSYFLLPLALVIVTWYWTLSVPAADLIVTVAQVTVGAMSVNAGIAVAQLTAGKPAVLPFLPRFWDASQGGSVAVLAAENGRYTGIFDQPAEAGLAYGLALLCTVFLLQRGGRGAPLAACAAALVTGGALSVSKVFLLGALPLALLGVLRGRARVRVFGAAAAGWGAFLLLGSAKLLPTWRAGSAAVQRLSSPAVAAWSGSRYGTAGTLGPDVAAVLHASPWYGFGAGGLDVPYDSLWLQALAVAGLAGMVLVAALLGVLVWQWLALQGTLSRPEWLLAGFSLALAAGASAGFPSVTADRAGTLLWLMLGLLVSAQVPSAAVHDDQREAGPPIGGLAEAALWAGEERPLPPP